MAIDFEKLMENKSDDGLQNYLDNRMKFTPIAVRAAIAEMQKRGRNFTVLELASFEQEFEAKHDSEEKEKNEYTWNKWKKNIVTDENAPAYYSEKAIYLFSIFFSVIFGAVLLAINCLSTNERKNTWKVIAFGFIYTAIQFWLLSLLPRNTGFTLTFNMGGAFLMHHFFWKNYIGKDTKYSAKPIWKPLIIGIIIFIPIIFAITYNETK